METEGHEGSHQPPKRFKPKNHTEIPSTSSKDSTLANSNLPQELITAILVRLPVKYLLQFKCVSKHWFALISSPEFVKTHLSLSAKDFTRHRLLWNLRKGRPLENNLKHFSVSSLFYESVTEAFDLDYPMKDLAKPVWIVGSANGLICYCLVGAANCLVLWNPSTRKFKQVPHFMHSYGFSYGFGYDEARDDYKVVTISHEFDKDNDFARIYSLKRDSWRTLDDFQGRIVSFTSGKLVNGKLHWLTVVGYGWSFVSIDLVDEKCRKVEQPCFGVKNPCLRVGVLGSDFSVLCSSSEIIDVWVMKEYGVKESWKKLCTIKFAGNAFSPPLCMSIEGEILLMFESTLTIYKPVDDLMRSPEVTNIDGHLEADYAYREAELYIESLVSPILENEPISQY